MSGDLKQLVGAFRTLESRGQPLVLATIVETEGSTYRKAGARVLLTADGYVHGMLGGGSFEQELLELARPVFADGRARIIECEMPSRRDADPELEWVRDGVARILLQHLSPAEDYRAMSLIAEAVETQSGKVLVTVIDSTDPEVAAGTCFLAGADAAREISAELHAEIGATADAALDTGKPMLVHHPAAGGDLEVFYCPVLPPLRLLIAGAVPDTVPVVQFGALLGWDITVIDSRRSRVETDAFPGAGRVSFVPAPELAAGVALEGIDAVLLMMRNFELDLAYLRQLAHSPVPWIGVLGSARRCARMLDKLGDDADRVKARLHGPAGLDIHADTPEEIALSIVAGIQAAGRPRAARPSPGGMPEDSAEAAHLCAVVLAAGESRRYGGFKQLVEFQGESMLRRISRVASELLPGRVIVVHGPKPTKCRRELNGVDVINVTNQHWKSGMAPSLRAGIKALPPECRAAMILLCDQPLVGAAQLRALIRAWAGAPERITASSYDDTTGVPAIIPRQYFDEILQLTGDRGAKSVIDAHRESLVTVAIPEAGVDIDTQEDYSRLLLGS